MCGARGKLRNVTRCLRDNPAGQEEGALSRQGIDFRLLLDDKVRLDLVRDEGVPFNALERDGVDDSFAGDGDDFVGDAIDSDPIFFLIRALVGERVAGMEATDRLPEILRDRPLEALPWRSTTPRLVETVVLACSRSRNDARVGFSG